jgi:hypothetical protein
MGCDGRPAPKPVHIDYHEGEEIRYWHCPKHFIPQSIYQWWDIYVNCRKPSISEYDQRKLIYLEAVNVYETEMMKYKSKGDK